jgi:hypothetical protein
MMTIAVLEELPEPSVAVYVTVLLPTGNATVSPGLYVPPGFVSMVTYCVAGNSTQLLEGLQHSTAGPWPSLYWSL